MGIYSDIYSEKIDKARKEDENGNKCLYSYVLDGYDYLQGGVLKEDLNVTGDLVLSDGELDLAGHTLTVSGNFIQKGGTVSVNKGKLIVNKDYRMQDYRIIENETSEENTSDGDDTVSENTTGGNNEDAKGETEEEKQIEYSSSYGILQMSEETDYVLIKGNFYAQSMATQKGSLTAGTMEVQGNFIQSGNFYATDNHKVTLTGDKSQKVIYDKSLNTNITNRIHHLNIENKSPEGVIFENNPTVSGTLNEGDSNISGGISICSTTEFTKETFPGNVTILEDFVLDKNMTFEGSLTALGKLTVEKTATVKKDVTVKELSMTGGRLNCGQNFEAESLQMKQPEDYIFIEKNATIQKGTATEGTIEVKGNVTFTGDFDAGGNHKFIFSGNEKQEYTETQIKGYNSISHHAALQNVEFQNYSEEGIVAEWNLLYHGC